MDVQNYTKKNYITEEQENLFYKHSYTCHHFSLYNKITTKPTNIVMSGKTAEVKSDIVFFYLISLRLYYTIKQL